MLHRPRRNRKSQTIRELVQETHILPSDLIYPIFIIDGLNIKNEIPSLPKIYQLSIDNILTEIQECIAIGLKSFILFPIVFEHLKDKEATYSYNSNNFYLRAISTIKQKYPEVCLISDVAMDPYSSDGHDGYVDENGSIDNDKTLIILSKMAIAQAKAGIDIIGPSDMMDGRVAYLRNSLDNIGYTSVSIMSYTAKYASAFYGPFRDALASAPKFGNKKTYQMNPANKREALIEAELDKQEGADFLMIKPALHYLDIIHILKEKSNLPIVAYHVSGEYAMLHAAANNNWLNYETALKETITCIKRAGADIIITYAAKQILS